YAREVELWGRRLSLGTNLKFFSSEFSETGAAALTGSGYDLDFGLLYQYNQQLRFGLSAINFVPGTAGAKLSWSDGVEETMPAQLKVGASVNIMGENSYIRSKQKITAAVDIDTYPTIPDSPLLWHLGVEWLPIDMFALRAGIDQGRRGAEQINNYTFGAGLKFGGLRFDYAYHTFYDISQFASSYFSVAYVPEQIIRQAYKPKEYFSLYRPATQEVVYQEDYKVIGDVVDDDVVRVTINGVDVSIEASGRFSLPLQMNYRANKVVVAAFAKNDRLLKQFSGKVIRLKYFSDVLDDYWAREPIEYLATLNIVSGYPDYTFHPEAGVTRAEITSLLEKIIGTPKMQVDDAPFVDVPPNFWAASYIKSAADRGFVKGYLDGTFKPNKTVSRAEAVTLVVKYLGLDASRVLEPPFPDVPGRFWAAKDITTAKEAGLLGFLEGHDFEPDRAMTRAELAEILAQSKFAKPQIDEIKN
ncbi:MAG: S-layer homology domain-containing protein, partial [Candidatus Margulisbacteria bacterium]|nr:S-layer homology domain-containing protein [Candidatus Margulisiibacteriota bacterium]